MIFNIWFLHDRYLSRDDALSWLSDRWNHVPSPSAQVVIGWMLAYQCVVIAIDLLLVSWGRQIRCMDTWEGALALLLCYWIPYRSRGARCIVVFWDCWSTGVPDPDVSAISWICTVLIFDADFTKHGFSGLEDYIEFFCLCIGDIRGEAGSILFMMDALVRSKRSLIGVTHKLGGWLLNIWSIQSHIRIPCNLRSALRCHRRLAVSPRLLSLRLDWYAQSIGCRWL